MAVQVSYVSASCNQTPAIADWGQNGLICYGSSNAVLIYDLTIGGGKITHTLSAHTNRVNSVCWIKGGGIEETELVSVSSDSNVIVWAYKEKDYHPTILNGHTSNVNVVSALYKNVEKGHAVIVSASDDSTIKLWMRLDKNAEFLLHQNLDLGYSICIAMKLSLVPGTEELLMAAATERSEFDIYVEKENNLEKACSLKGHDDWVRGLDYVSSANGDILLASTSQDAFVRIWQFVSESNFKESEHNKYIEPRYVQTSIGKFTIVVKCVLFGHEGWIYSAHWNSDGSKLLTISLDKNIIIWEYNDDAEIWMESVRLGEVGGNTLGFYGGMFNSDATSLLAHGYHGAFHIWKLNKEMEMWDPQVTVGGHFEEVVDLCWEPSGEYVMSVSCDQTTRVHAPWKRDNDSEMTWHEIARPQVHGYDLSCLALLGRYEFVSGAEEKIIRAFRAPDNFVQNFKRLCQIEDNSEYKAPKGASVPSLGLSNKAVYTNDNIEQASVKSNKDPYPEESHFKAIDLTEPPTEETLLQNTLWPEVQKLYGHGYELYSLAASPDGKYVASGCKSSLPEHAAIILWETTNWQIVQRLQSHTLTVAQISFSPDGEHILSVSRDRRWSLFSKNPNGEFTLAATTNKATGIHSRIIWTCAWTHDSRNFATGSRDGKVVVWRINPEKVPENVLGKCEAASEPLTLSKDESVTALAFAPLILPQEDGYLLAVGVEKGYIYLYKWNKDGFKETRVLNHSLAHHKTVKRLAFRPILGKAGEKQETNILQLASCSSDHSVRIFDIDIEKL